MTTWENFVARRKINVSLFLSHNSINDREEFVSHLISHGIEPPGEDTLNKIFPPLLSIFEEVETTTQQPETDNPVAPRRNTKSQYKKQ